MNLSYTLTPEEKAFLRGIAETRNNTGNNDRRISTRKDVDISFCGIAGEYCAARILGMHWEPVQFKSKADLFLGPTTISLKSRHASSGRDFMFTPRQSIPNLRDFPDTYGLVGYWDREMNTYTLYGYFTSDDWNKRAVYEQMIFSETRDPDDDGYRQGYYSDDMYPVEELVREIDRHTAERVSSEDFFRHYRQLWEQHLSQVEAQRSKCSAA